MDKEKQDRIKEKARMKIAVVNFNEEQITKSKNGILKMVATFVLAIGITTGLVYGGSVVYDKIWKEPESYKISKDISEEEKAKCISEEEAEKIGNSYLKKIGLSDETIQSLGLTKEFLSDENVWHMGSQKATLTIDAEKGIIKSVQIPTWEYKIPYNYGITREEARKVAKELLEKYRPEDDKGDYELVKLTRNMETDEASYIWYAIFQKKYGDLYNANEEINIGWVPTINGLYNLSFKRNVYENNEEKISKEEAMKIATEKDKQIDPDASLNKVEVLMTQEAPVISLKNQPLENGKITYVDKDKATEFVTAKKGKNKGKFTIKNLMVGTYAAYETKNPNYGYEIVKKTFEESFMF